MSKWDNKITNFLKDNKDLITSSSWSQLLGKAKRAGIQGSILYILGKALNVNPYPNSYFGIDYDNNRTLCIASKEGNNTYNLTFTIDSFIQNRTQVTFKSLKDAIDYIDSILHTSSDFDETNFSIKVFTDKAISDYDYEQIDTEYGSAYASTWGIADKNTKELNKKYKTEESKLLSEVKQLNYTFSKDYSEVLFKDSNKHEFKFKPIKAESDIKNGYVWQTHDILRVMRVQLTFEIETSKISDLNLNNYLWRIESSLRLYNPFADTTEKTLASLANKYNVKINLSRTWTNLGQARLEDNQYYLTVNIDFERDI